MVRRPGAGIALAFGLAAAGCGETPEPDIAALKAVLEAEAGGPVVLRDVRRDHGQRYTLTYAREGEERRASFRYVDHGWRITREHDAKMRLRYF